MSAPSSPECLPTSGESSFRDLIHRVRTKEGPATEELVRRYGPYIRRVARYRMRSIRRLGPPFDSEDIRQIVLHSFFRRLAGGQYELDTRGQLLALLKTMTGNKVKDQARRLYAARRDVKRTDPIDVASRDPTAPDEGPCQEAIFNESIKTVIEQLLTEEELRLANLRAGGVKWIDIPPRPGDSPEALRKRRDRAIQRVQAWLQARS